MKQLIILRGNSGSGKTSVAKALQRELGHGTMLVSQDVVRREMLYIKDTTPGPTKTVIERLVRFGLSDNRIVIVEGILSALKYGELLRQLMEETPGSLVYYFDITFEETLRRHTTKPNAHEFGETEMRRWWKEDDFLGVAGEKAIDDTMSEDATLAMIMQGIHGK